MNWEISSTIFGLFLSAACLAYFCRRRRKKIEIPITTAQTLQYLYQRKRAANISEPFVHRQQQDIQFPSVPTTQIVTNAKEDLNCSLHAV